MKSRLFLFLGGIILVLSLLMVGALVVNADTTLVTDTFEGKTDGYVPTSGDGWTITTSTGDSVQVKAAPTTANPSNMALKIYKTNGLQGSSVLAKRTIDNGTANKIQVSYNVKFESNLTQYLRAGPSLIGYKTAAPTTDITATSTLSTNPAAAPYPYNVQYHWWDATHWDSAPLIADVSVDPNRWYNVKYIINTVADTMNVYLDNVLKYSNVELPRGSVVSPLKDIDGLKRLDFQAVTNNAAQAASTPMTVWYDDISVVILDIPALAVTSSSPIANSTGVSVQPTVTMDFNQAVNAATVNNTNVKVLKDGAEIATNLYTVSLPVANRISIAFSSPLDYKSHYSVSVSTAVLPTNTLADALASNYTLTFKTIAPPFDLEEFSLTDTGGNPVGSVATASGKTIQVRAVLSNNNVPLGQNYAVTIALFSPDNELVYAKANSGNLPIANKVNIADSIAVPANVGAGWTLECFVWDSYAGMKTIYTTEIR